LQIKKKATRFEEDSLNGRMTEKESRNGKRVMLSMRELGKMRAIARRQREDEASRDPEKSAPRESEVFKARTYLR